MLEATVVVWNTVEGVVAIAAGLAAASVALLGFGIDSTIEITSAAVVWWRLRHELRGEGRADAERIERTTGRIAGSLLLLLAVYIVVDAGRRIFGYGQAAEPSLIGIALTALSLVAMPVFGWLKLKTARQLGSRALRADAFETIACAWLSLTTLAGLSLNAAVGWSWADPLAALLIVPLVVREGLEGLRGEEEETENDELSPRPNGGHESSVETGSPETSR